MRRSVTELGWLVSTGLAIAWGAAAFGSTYDWAYRPLIIASASLGLSGYFLGARYPAPSRLILLSLLSIAGGVALQLILISRDILEVLSPNASRILAQQNLLFAVRAAIPIHHNRGL